MMIYGPFVKIRSIWISGFYQIWPDERYVEQFKECRFNQPQRHGEHGEKTKRKRYFL